LLDVDRVSARDRLSKSEKKLSGIIYERGVDDTGFAIIRSKGDQALFGGYSTNEMKKKSGENAISDEHVENNRAVRRMLIERGVKPEALPPAEDVKKLQRKLDGDEKKLLKTVKKKKGQA
jgi:DNA-damage-inducible protein D